ASDLEGILGPKLDRGSIASHHPQVGVVNGLAWTSVGGEMLPIEAVIVDGSGKIELTGSLGDVMKESAKIALTLTRILGARYGVPADFAKDKDVHIHAPEGAVPKDGPSAGVTLVTALVSAASGLKVRSDIAMTGEITLTGEVLPIGGLKEKLIAAYREKMKVVLIPKTNIPDLYDVSSEVKKGLRIVPVETVDEVLEAALIKRRGKQAAKKTARKTPEKTTAAPKARPVILPEEQPQVPGLPI
ncbi:MAG: S16 family serine protease, partial [Oscillospiraceae bacterium]